MLARLLEDPPMRVCGNCQSDVEDGSPACPRCGAEMPRGFFGGLMTAVFGKRRSSASEKPAGSTRYEPEASARSAGEPFSFEVEDIFTITGRGMVTTGRVTRGRIAVGDEVKFQSPKGELVKRRIVAIEAFRKTVKEANEGETVGLLFSKPVPADVLVRGARFERA
jgi:hypothetical protein